MSTLICANSSPRFVGRASEIREIAGLVAGNGQSAIVVGEPRAGKTSLLKHLRSPEAAPIWENSGSNPLLFTAADAHLLADTFDPARFWVDVLEPISISGPFVGADVSAAYRSCKKRRFEASALRRLFARAEEVGFRVVLVIDEFDYLVHRCVGSHKDFFAGLRSLTQSGSLAVIAASRERVGRLNEMAYQYAVAGSPYFNTLHEVILGPLSEQDVVDLVQLDADSTEATSGAILALTGGHPYLVQVVLAALKRLRASGANPEQQLDGAAAALLEEADPTLSDIWNHWPPRTRYAFAAAGVEHLEDLGEDVAWGSVGEPVTEMDTFRQELYRLKRHGFVATRVGHGGTRHRVRPLVFLAWLATKFRGESQSLQRWMGWMQTEGWVSHLSPRLQETWMNTVREHGKSVKTDVAMLLRASQHSIARVRAAPHNQPVLPLATATACVASTSGINETGYRDHDGEGPNPVALTTAPDYKGKVDFAILTIRDDEFAAVLGRFPPFARANGRRVYNFHRLDLRAGDSYLIAVLKCIEQGNAEALDAARDILEELDPQWLLVVGIAGGVPSDELTLGDVVVSTRIVDFSVEAVLEDKPSEYAVMGGPVHKDAAAILANLRALGGELREWGSAASIVAPRPPLEIDCGEFYGDEIWQKRARAGLARQAARTEPIVTAGAVGSSDRLVKDTRILASFLLKAARQVLAVEMESAGVYRAATGRGVPSVAIRGLSDVVGFKRNADWTVYACHTAAAFARAFLQSRPIEPRATGGANPGMLTSARR